MNSIQHPIVLPSRVKPHIPNLYLETFVRSGHVLFVESRNQFRVRSGAEQFVYDDFCRTCT